MSLRSAGLASLWENPDWALLGTLNGTFGYDSNLTLLRDGPGGTYLNVNPLLTLDRQNSESQVQVQAGANRLQFLSGGQESETDPYFNATIAYPNVANAIPVYKINALWQQSSQPNEFVGERVRNDLGVLSGEGYLTLTGKLGIRGNAELDSQKFDSPELNDFVKGSAFVGLAYEAGDATQYSINFGAALGHSTPNDPANTDENVHSTEYDVTGRVTGQITDKITGNVYAGFGTVSYTGGYSNRVYIPVGGADLTWGLNPRQTVVLAAYSGATNAPDGTAVETTHAFLSFVDAVVSDWQLTVRAGPTYTKFSRQVEERSDDVWEFGGEFAYVPSSRFKIALDATYSRHNSNIYIFQFDHDVVSLTASYNF